MPTPCSALPDGFICNFFQVGDPQTKPKTFWVSLKTTKKGDTNSKPATPWWNLAAQTSHSRGIWSQAQAKGRRKVRAKAGTRGAWMRIWAARPRFGSWYPLFWWVFEGTPTGTSSSFGVGTSFLCGFHGFSQEENRSPPKKRTP